MLEAPGPAEIEVDFAPGLQFEAFYAESYPQVAKALAITLRDDDLGAEAADEAMARAYSKWPVVQNYDNPAGWVYRVGLNWARSALRKLSRRKATAELGVVQMAPISDPAIEEALGELDVKLRSVVVCRYLLDWSEKDTAAALDIKPGTVKSRLHRALQILETKLRHLNQPQ